MKLHVAFEEINSEIKTKFIETTCTFRTDFGELFVVRTNDVYDGNYNVIPRVYQQTLETKDKLMLDDVIVEVIPLSKVINIKNGYTVTIG